MKIKQTCRYIARNYNLLPAVLVTPKEDGFIIAFKWLNLHYGVYLYKKPAPEDFMTYFNGKYGEQHKTELKKVYRDCYPDITDQRSESDVMYRC